MVVAGLLRAIPGRQVTPEKSTGEPAEGPKTPGARKSQGSREQAEVQKGRSMISKFFIERPIFANVIAIVIIILGVVCLYKLPVSQYPEIVPPTIQVTTSYPGASAEVIATTVGIPIEQAVNGVKNSLYMNLHQRQ